MLRRVCVVVIAIGACGPAITGPQPDGCPDGASRCSGSSSERCESGSWRLVAECQVCSGGQCTGAGDTCRGAGTLKTSFPYVAVAPPTVVRISACSTAAGSGYRWARMLEIVEGIPDEPIRRIGGAVQSFDVTLNKRTASGAELAVLSNATGLPTHSVQTEGIGGSGADAVTAVTPLPAGAYLWLTLAVSSTTGSLRVNAPTDAAMNQILARMEQEGLALKLTLETDELARFTYSAMLRLKAGKLSFKVTGIE
jgi:hypothetical protein